MNPVARQRRALDSRPDPRPPLEGEIKQACVVIPCHNEEKRLDVESLVAFVAEGIEIHVLLVDDGSSDETARLITQAAARMPGRIHALVLPQNVGKGNAVRAGMLRAVELGAELVAYLDADLATPTSEMGRLIAIQRRAGFDVILGSRVAMLGHDIDRSLKRHYLGRLYSTMASLALGFQVYDTQCGAKLFSVNQVLTDALREPFETRWAFDVELLARMTTEDPNVLILEVPLRHWADIDGSKVSTASMARAVFDLLQLGRRESLRRRTRRTAGQAVVAHDWDGGAWHNRRRGERRNEIKYVGPDRRQQERRETPRD